MFASLARRLTAWYVFVAILLVVLLAGSVVAVGLTLYARDANEQIGALARQVPDIEARAVSDGDDWTTAQALLLRRLARPGLTVATRQPPPPPFARPPRGGFSMPRRPDDRPLFGNRLGFVAASSLGIHVARERFMGGFAIIFVDVDRLAAIVETSLVVLLATGIFAGLVAWVIGRYITSQALRPLYDVTSALVRFAGRDFTAQPINVAGRTEFDELVRAYNAAAHQVAVAFDERATAEAQMRQFVADAGHELRTPLTIVLGYIDLLRRRSADDDRSRRIFETIAIEGSRMRTLIDNLVLLARLEGEDVRPVVPFELTPLLEHDIVRTRLGMTPGVKIDLDVAVDATVIGDRGEIYEALSNLIDNAIKYAPGSVIAVRVFQAPGGVDVLISDGGPGIDPADRELIFDRFYRGTLRVGVEGSGLGLPIAKRAIERAGGTLCVVSTSPTGTTFRARLRADRVSGVRAAPVT